MHTVIYGPPGTGKTEVARLIAQIYCKLGVLKNGKGLFKKVTRSDLVAGYLGQTAIKTKDVITECLGGVLFIDEAYSLGNPDKKDSFSKECIDTLCEALSAHKDELMVIIAGYETELKECFFNYNQGLDSRFPWRFKTDEYGAAELLAIFSKKVRDIGWSCHCMTPEWFEKNKIYFKYFGRDIEILLSKIKIAHGRRVFCQPDTGSGSGTTGTTGTKKTVITAQDFEKGFQMFLKNDEVAKRKNDSEKNYALTAMYV
jgi:SpoVK/Ycf46/Vps4 family AAA+-type ATPase